MGRVTEGFSVEHGYGGVGVPIEVLSERLVRFVVSIVVEGHWRTARNRDDGRNSPTPEHPVHDPVVNCPALARTKGQLVRSQKVKNKLPVVILRPVIVPGVPRIGQGSQSIGLA